MRCTQNFIRFFVLNFAPGFPRKWPIVTRKHVLAFVSTDKENAVADLVELTKTNFNAGFFRNTYEKTKNLDILDLWLNEFARAANRDLIALEKGDYPF